MMSMIIKLVQLLSLFSIAMSTVVTEDKECPIWFKRNENGFCECGPLLEGAIECNSDKQVASIMVGYCMSFDNSSQQLLLGFNNDRCFNHRARGGFNRVYNDLPTNITELRELCRERNQRGLLCGECKAQYGYSINSLYTKCLKCRALYATLMCLLTIFLVTVFCVLVVIFHLNFTSGPMLGYTIFCQVSYAVLRSNIGLFHSFDTVMGSFGSTVLNVSMAVSSMWWYFAAVFFAFPHACLSKHVTRLQVVCLDYIFVLYPLFFLIVTYVFIELHARGFRPVVYLWKPFHKCFVKVRRNWSASDSIIHAYATFFFLSFTALAFSCFNILYSTNIYNINGTVIARVLVYEPTMKIFSPQHLPYAITAITLLFLLGFCPTLFLCLCSTRLFTRRFRLSPRTQLLLHTFTDTFQCCYKDGLNGTNDYRFLSPGPMVLYLSMVLVSIHSNSSSTKVLLSYLLLYSALFLVLSIAIALVKPYKSTYMNFSLCFHSAILGFGTWAVILWMDGHTVSTQLIAEVFTLLVSLPHLLALITAIYYILNKIRLTRAMIQLSFKKISAIFCQTDKEHTREPLPDRLEHSSLYQNIPDI